ncbi:SipW-dependent-type signal peptide-containing protein [Rhodococcoides kyotonense]|uniref:SipW-cognate class signal peptide n=1 Tax=Rhodococcoides kyotonense TaxID=398843 RepID=A0A239GHG1_9NOCA|nr:SipW-dependent-type signal peptide-containing protein [Rhodococcus kyotonensis]SNS68325.1 SipW-cognate class signal peptide [Rhodococcus kyotonensis]
MTDQQVSTRKRKIRALLAGGLVLGVGAAITLAAWTDNVFGNSDFATGDDTWNIQASFSGTATPTWVESDVSPGQTFGFPAPRLNLTPSDTVYAPIALRLEPGQTLGAAVTLNGATGGSPAGAALTSALRYSVTSGGTAAGCAAGTPGGTTVVAAASTLTTGSAADAITLAADGTPVQLCFAVTLPAGTPNTISGLNTGQLIWQFVGTSIA